MVFSGPIKTKLQKPQGQLGYICILDFNFNFLLPHRYTKRRKEKKKICRKEHIRLYSQNFSLSPWSFSQHSFLLLPGHKTQKAFSNVFSTQPLTPSFCPFLWRWWPVSDFSRFLNVPTGLSGSWACTYLVQETPLWVMGVPRLDQG